MRDHICTEGWLEVQQGTVATRRFRGVFDGEHFKIGDQVVHFDLAELGNDLLFESVRQPDLRLEPCPECRPDWVHPAHRKSAARKLKESAARVDADDDVQLFGEEPEPEPIRRGLPYADS